MSQGYGQGLPNLLDGSLLDAFGRQRVSSPTTIFDFQSQYDLGPLLWEDDTAGSGSVAHVPNESAVTLSVTAASGDRVTRQSRQYHRYQPGKSQLILMTFVLGAVQTGTVKRVGYFDDQNGLFLEYDSSGIRFVRRTFTSGAAVDNEVAQASWNQDTFSDLDLTKAQILAIDFEWLGVGSVRMGFVVDGAYRYCHQFNNANNLDLVYMATGNLPVRYEIENTAASAVDSLDAICASVISEGGFESDRGLPFCASNGVTTIGVTTRRPILSIRPKATFNSIVNRGQIVVGGANAYATTNTAYIEIVYGGALTGASFSSVDDDSITEFDVAATAISGGHPINAFYVPASGFGVNQSPGANTLGLLSRLPLVLDKSGANPIPITVVATSFTATSNVSGSLFWQELR